MSHDGDPDLPQGQSVRSTPKPSRQTIRQGIGEGVSVILFLLGTGIQLFWPDQKGLGLVFMIAGGAGIVLIGIWALALHVARKQVQASLVAPVATPEITQQQNTPINNTNTNAPVFTFAPTINQNQSQEQTQTAPARVSVPPEIECTDCYVVQETLSAHWNTLGEANGRPCRAAMANFYLKPVPGANPWIELRTHLVFYGPNDTRLRRVQDGMWTEQGNIKQIPMRTSDTRTLVIAIEFDEVGFTTYEYHEEPSRRPRFTTTGIYHHFLQPTLTPLNENSLTVEVSLIGKYLDEVKLNQNFWFLLTRPDMTIKQIPVPHFASDSVRQQLTHVL